MPDKKTNDDDFYVNDELTAAFLDSNPDVSDQETLDKESSRRSLTADRDWIEDDQSEVSGQLKMDVYETKDQLVIRVPVPGVDKDALDLSLSDNMLTIKGQSNNQRPEDSGNSVDFLLKECKWGEAARSFSLPVAVNEENIDASLNDGVLTVVFDKVRQEDVVKKIDIK